MKYKENTLIEHILEGNVNEYRELVDRYQTGLIIHCENILKDRDEGEDIAQEAFVKAYVNLKNFTSDKARFSTWLYRIATNLCMDHLRKQKRTVRLKDIEERAEETDPSAIKEDDIQHIRKLVEALEPPKYAAIIKAYFWEGKSYQEIALEHNTSTNTIGTWISRAKLQLRGQLS